MHKKIYEDEKQKGNGEGLNGCGGGGGRRKGIGKRREYLELAGPKFRPVIVTRTPTVGPEEGEILVTFGAANIND